MNNKTKIIITIILIILLCGICVFMVSGVLHVVHNADINSNEPDPMFETPAEIVTRPPEMDMEEIQPEHATLDNYIDDTQTPVDKTAEELAREAESVAERTE